MKKGMIPLKIVRILLATLMFAAITLLFLDFTGILHHWLGWIAQLQFLPALLALNISIIIVLLLMTAIFGRIYCSVICPLGIMQDIIAWFSTRSIKKRNKYHFTKAKNILRYMLLGLFAGLMIVGVHSIAILIAPYSAYGRIAQNLLSPIYNAGNNVLAYFAEQIDSYAFYPAEIWIRSIPTFIIALITFIVIAILAYKGGRTWCNTVCPVGTLLGLISKYAIFKPVIDKDKCIKCHVCEKRCKAACIDSDQQTIDASRCVICMNCIDNCRHRAIQYKFSWGKKSAQHAETRRPVHENQSKPQTDTGPDTSEETGADSIATARRGFLLSLPALAVSSVARAEDKLTDGGMAELKPRQRPDRGDFALKPAGARSFRNFSTRCTACQLCVASCPNGVLRPSTALSHLMQPEMDFDKGFCRPECTRCAQVCPTGAIQPIIPSDKSSIQIGHAVWVKSLCLPVADGTQCGNCARHCPNGAIEMIEIDSPKQEKIKVPSVDTERCIGCGACEYVCPVRPISAIHIVGHEVHKEI